MHAAIKALEDTLLIRRLQARELEHEKNNAERIAAIQEDISSLERGLRLLTSDSPGRSAPAEPGPSDTSNSPGSPTNADPGQNNQP